MAVDIIIDPLTGQIYWNDSQTTAQSIAISGNGSDLIKVVGYSLGYTAAPSGTITTGAATTAVTGSGTAFTTQLAQGAILYTAQGTSIGTVSTITNDTSLSLTTNASGSYTAISFRITPSTGTDRVVFSDSATPIYPATTGANLGTSSYRWSVYASAGDFTNTSTTAPNLVIDKSGISSTESSGLQIVNTSLATSGGQYQFPSWMEFKGKVWNSTVTAASNDARMRLGMAVNPGTSPQTEFVLASSIDTGTPSWYYPLTINSTANDSIAYFNNSVVSIGKLLTNGTTSSYALEIYNYNLATSGQTVNYSPGFEMNGSGWNTSTATSNIVRFRSEVQPTSGASVAGTLVWKSAVATSYSATPSFTDRFKIASDGTVTIPGSLTLGSASGALYASTGTVSVGTLPVTSGGTGQTTYTDGQLLIGNSTGNTLTKATLTAGTNISITNGNGSITINATSGGSGTVSTGADGKIAYYAGAGTVVDDATALDYSTATTTSHLTITAQAVGNTPLLLKASGAGAQTGDLLKIQSSTATALVTVDSTGIVAIANSTNAGATTSGALKVTGGIGVQGTSYLATTNITNLAVSSDITSATASLNVLNANVTTLNIGGAATSLALGSSAGTATINNATVAFPNATSFTGTSATITFLGSATTATAFGSATSLTLGATSGTGAIRNATIDFPNATTISASSALATVFSAANPSSLAVFGAATTATIFGSAASLTIGATSGTGTIRNATIDFPNATTISGSSGLATVFSAANPSSLAVFGAATTATIFGSATSLTIGTTSGTATVRNATLALPNVTSITGTSAAITVFGESTSITLSNTTAASTLNLASGNNGANTKTVNLGTGGAGAGASNVNVGAATGTFTVNMATSNIGTTAVSGTVAVLSSSFTANNATTFSATSATTLSLGSSTGTATISNTTVSFPNATTISGSSGLATVFSAANPTSLAVFGSATTATIFGAATALSLGSSTGTATISNTTVSFSNATVISGSSGLATVFSAANPSSLAVFGSATTATIFGSATSLSLGSSTGTATISNTTVSFPNATTISGSSGLATVFSAANPTSLAVFGAATTATVLGSATSLTLGTTSGTTTIRNTTVTFTNATNFTGTTGTVAFLAEPTTVTAFAAATTATVFGTTSTATFNFATGTLSSGQTKTINIGTGGVATSTTAITIGNTSNTTNSTISFAGNRLQNVGEPTQPQDAATKFYVDSFQSGLDLHESVRAVAPVAIGTSVLYFQQNAPSSTLGTAIGTSYIESSNNETLSTTYFDNLSTALAVGNRVLVALGASTTTYNINGVTTAPTGGTNVINGIYSVTSVGGAGSKWRLDRATDTNDNIELQGGTFAFVQEGAIYADSGWVCTNNTHTTAISIGSDAISWTQFSGAGQITAGAGLTKTGNTIDIGAGTGITVNADTIQISATYAGQNTITTLGTITTGTWNATTIALANGGTGTTSYANNNGLIYFDNGNSRLTSLATGATTTVLVGGGASAPSFAQVNLTNMVTGTLPLGNGGLGTTTFTQYGILYGNAATSVLVTAAGSTDQVLKSGGGSGAPSWGAINLSSTNAVSGTLPISNGGTGSTTATSAINALLPSQTGNNGKYLTTDGTSASWGTVAASPGGSNGQIQFNNSSSFDGAAALIYSSATTTAHLTVTSQAVGNTPLLLKGIASQSANLFDVQNSSGTSLVSIASVGGGVGAKFQIQGTSSNQDDLLLISNSGTMTIAGGYGGQRGLRTLFRTNGNATADRYFWSIGRGYDGFGYFGFGCDESTGVGFSILSATEGFPLSVKFIEDSTTNTVKDVINIERTTSGTAAAGIGARISYRQEHAGGTLVNTIGLDGILSDAGSTTYVGALSIKTNDTGTTTLVERARFDNTDLALYPYGTTAGSTYELRFMELAANGSNYIGFKGPDSVTTNYTYVWPSGAPSSGQLLSASAPVSGVVTLSWATDQLGTSGGGITSLNGLSAASQSFANDTNVTITSATSTHTLGWTGQLAMSRGGTGTSTAATQWGVAYGLTTTSLAYTAAGSTDQVLKSGGGSAAPTWGAISLGSTNAVSGTLGVANGGTGQTTYTDGQLLIGNSTGNTLTKATLTAGTNISITNGNGSITINATSGGSGTVSSGTANQIAYYSGTTTTASAPSMVYSAATTTSHLTITAQAVGNNPLKLIGATSQTADLFTVATSGGTVFNISSTGVINSGTWNGTTIAVGYGGTGTSAAPTQWGVIFATSTSQYASTGAGSTDAPLLARTGAAPAFAALPLGSSNAVTGILGVTNGGTGTSSFATSTILTSNAASTTGAVTTATALAYSTTNQHLTITAQGAATSPLRLVGTTSQTADLFQIYSTSAGTVLGSVGAFGGATFTSLATSATTPATALFVTGAAHTALNATSEYSDVYFNLGQTKTFATGAITILRTFRVAPATYAFSGASTVTNAATFQIDGAPAAGTNATLTEAAALRILTGTASGKGLVIRGSSSQTGSYIDVQNNSGTSLVTLGTTNINLGAHGASAGNTFELRFSELAANGSEYIAFKAPDAITTSYTYVWPSGTPTSGQLLSASAPSTTGIVTLSWATDQLGTSGGGITSLNSATGASQTFSNDTNVIITTNTGTNTHALGWQGSLAISRGGIGTTSLTTSNGLVYFDNANSKLATLGTGATTTVLVGGGASAPSFAQVNLTSMVTGTLPLGNGGLGTTTFTQYGILYGNAGTSILVTAAGSTDQVLKSGNGTGAPSWGAISLGSSNAVSGILGLTNGGTATSSFATTNGLIYYTGSALASLATSASGVLVTNGSGVPSISTDIPTAVTIGGAYVYRAGGTDVALADGGTGQSTYANGDILYYNSTSSTTALTKLGIAATSGYFLTSTGSAPQWSQTLGLANGGTGLTSGGTGNYILGMNSGGSALEYKQLVQGSNVTITHGVGTITIAASGGTSSALPGGSDTFVQYNNAGAFGGTSYFAYDYSNALLTLTASSSIQTTSTPALSISNTTGPNTSIPNHYSPALDFTGRYYSAGGNYYARFREELQTTAATPTYAMVWKSSSTTSTTPSFTNRMALDATKGLGLYAYSGAGAGTNASFFKAGAQTSDFNYTLPTTAPSTSQILSVSAVSGSDITLTWANDATGSGGSGTVSSGTTSQLAYYSGATTTASAPALVYSATGTHLTITAQGASTSPLKVVGAASQSASIFTVSTSGGDVLTVDSSGFTSITALTDTGVTFQNATTTTKKFKFDAASITAGNTRTITIPDATTTMVGTDATQTLTNKTLSAAVVTTSATVTAAGTTSATATAVTSDYNVVTTSSLSTDPFNGVILPAATTGRILTVVNRSSNPIYIYPQSGTTIDGSTSPELLSINRAHTFMASSTTSWFQVAGAHKTVLLTFCTGYTPATTGADSVILRLPDNSDNPGNPSYYVPRELNVRVETPSAGTSAVQVEYYTGTSAFSATNLLSSALSITGASTYEFSSTGFSTTSLASATKLRINFTSLNATHANFFVQLLLEER